MKYVAIGILALVTMFGTAWIVQGNSFFMYKFFAPKQEEIRREVFEQTKSYNQGYIQELENMQFEYIKATPEQKDALASIILHRAADYDESMLPQNLRSFIYELRNERIGQ